MESRSHGGMELTMKGFGTGLVAAVFLACGAQAAPKSKAPPGPYGTWVRPEDGTTFTFAPCGAGGLCVRVKGVRDPADSKQIGTTVFSGAEKIADNVWKGEVFNSEDGQKYMGKITWNGADGITLEGCVLGGVICKGENWNRLR